MPTDPLSVKLAVLHRLRPFLPFLRRMIPRTFRQSLKGRCFDPLELEVSFHEEHLRSLRRQYRELSLTDAEFARRFFPPWTLPFFEDLSSRFVGDTISVLDVGAGLISVLLWGQITGLFELWCLDPLADRYEELFHRHGLSSPMRFVPQFGEDMRFDSEFHAVFCRNALDHCRDPRTVLSNMTHAVKPRGYILLSHAINEGERQGYTDLHQYNLDLENDQITLGCREGSPTPLTADMPLTLVWNQRDEDSEYFTAVFERV